MDGENNTLDLEKFEEIFQKEYESIVKNNGKCNAMVLGGTGVGKSTLINAVFGFSTAQTGTGNPITQKIKLHSHPNSPINIYDTPGLELNAKQIIQTKEEVVQLIADKKRNTDPREHIHFVWYCINERSNRFQNEEDEWIKDLVKQEVPVIIVLTQTYDPEDSKLLKYIKNLNLPVHDIIPVLAEPAKITKTITIPKYGLKKLIEVTFDSFPQQAEKAFKAAVAAAQEAERKARAAKEAAAQEEERKARAAKEAAAQEAEREARAAREASEKARAAAEAEAAARRAFAQAQKIDVYLKISEANNYLKGYVGGAAVAGSPFSGFFGGFAVAGVQTAMIAHLTAICGLEFNRSFLWPIYAGCAFISIPTLVVVSLPGLDFAGAPAAAIMTYCIGKAFIFGYELYLNHKIGKDELAQTIINRYKKILKEGIK
jgi:predicted GTPase